MTNKKHNEIEELEQTLAQVCGEKQELEAICRLLHLFFKLLDQILVSSFQNHEGFVYDFKILFPICHADTWGKTVVDLMIEAGSFSFFNF